jgi:hypothetical protein
MQVSLEEQFQRALFGRDAIDIEIEIAQVP